MDDCIALDGVNFEVEAIDYRILAIINRNEMKIGSNSGYTGNHINIFSENILNQEVHCVDENNNEHVFRFNNNFPLREGQDIKIIFIDNYAHFLLIKNLRKKFIIRGLEELTDEVFKRKYKKFILMIPYIGLLVFIIWLFNLEPSWSEHLFVALFYMAIAFGVIFWLSKFFIENPIKSYINTKVQKVKNKIWSQI